MPRPQKCIYFVQALAINASRVKFLTCTKTAIVGRELRTSTVATVKMDPQALDAAIDSALTRLGYENL